MSSISSVALSLTYHSDGCVFLDIEWHDWVGPGSFHEKLATSVTPRQAVHYAAMIIGRLEESEETAEARFEQLAFPEAGPLPPAQF